MKWNSISANSAVTETNDSEYHEIDQSLKAEYQTYLELVLPNEVS